MRLSERGGDRNALPSLITAAELPLSNALTRRQLQRSRSAAASSERQSSLLVKALTFQLRRPFINLILINYNAFTALPLFFQRGISQKHLQRLNFVRLTKSVENECTRLNVSEQSSRYSTQEAENYDSIKSLFMKAATYQVTEYLMMLPK